MTVTAGVTEAAGDELRGDWRGIEALYRQLSALKSGDDPSPPSLALVLDRLAEATAQVFASYEGMEEEFLTHLRKRMLEIDNVDWKPQEEFRNLCKDEAFEQLDLFSNGKGRPRPRPFEAAVETVRRIVDLNQIQSQLEGIDTTAILGGSLSFGRFFTVYGEYSKRPSDIDLILLVPHYSSLPEVMRELREVKDREKSKFIEEASLDQMDERVSFFMSKYGDEGSPIAFQHKLSLWNEPSSGYFKSSQLPLRYNLALHILSRREFQHISLKNFFTLSKIPSDEPITIRVYRDDPPKSDSEEQYCFAGLRRDSEVSTTPVEEGPGGYLTTIQVCEIFEDRFYPGMHLNLMLPQFEVRWESPRIRARLALQALRYKLLARLEDERQLHPRQILRLSFAHARSRQFAGRVAARLDGE